MIKKTALVTVVLLLFACLPLPAAAGAKANTDAVKAVLTAYLEGRYHWSRVEIKDLTLGGEDVLPGKDILPGEESGLPADIGIVREPPGKTVFELSFADGRKTEATAEVTAYATVIKSKRLLNKDSAIGPDDVYSAPQEVSRLGEGFFTDASSVVGGWLTCSIGPGVTISRRMVSFRPLVKRGQKVNIVIESPAFRITATGEILQDARVGTYAKVMNLSSKKLLSGFLADADTVRIRAEDVK
ncbi:MAG: flagellar basal body P-ring formation chaperone FlgA [Nitrospiraceae bacterium]|nr:flagellar basal body P-ring formation chaperone FlgA [Nitrospiraceae bacterium]